MNLSKTSAETERQRRGHRCNLTAPILSPARCCTPDLCDGTMWCHAPVHIHGCYADVPPALCTAIAEHGPPT